VTGEAEAPAGRWRALALVSAALLLSLAPWFSATAVIAELRAAWSLSGAGAAWLTNGVQAGFVAGALAASLVNLPDIVPLHRLMGGAALLAAAANAAILVAPGEEAVIAARIVTGFALAGVYPPALKMISTWFRRGRGLALGVTIGALTMGTGLPYLFRATLGTLSWQPVVVAATVSAAAGAAVFLWGVREGPFGLGRTVFDPRQVGAVVRNRPLLLVSLGYFGHMWELYAMWAWLIVFAGGAFTAQGLEAPALPAALTFAAIAAGSVGCILGGVLSDRIGRTATTAGMMIVSGACALMIGALHAGPTWLFVAVAIVWGVSIVGDSAQFSAAVTELADPRYVGTALSLQIGVGFALTIGVIAAVPAAAEWVGWRWAFAFLAVGPFVGAAAMLRLRSLPASRRLAGGLR
jgi:MFS family permease